MKHLFSIVLCAVMLSVFCVPVGAAQVSAAVGSLPEMELNPITEPTDPDEEVTVLTIHATPSRAFSPDGPVTITLADIADVSDVPELSVCPKCQKGKIGRYELTSQICGSSLRTCAHKGDCFGKENADVETVRCTYESAKCSVCGYAPMRSYRLTLRIDLKG